MIRRADPQRTAPIRLGSFFLWSLVVAWFLFWLLASLFVVFLVADCPDLACERRVGIGTAVLVAAQVAILAGTVIAGLMRRPRAVASLAVAAPVVVVAGFFVIAVVAGVGDEGATTDSVAASGAAQISWVGEAAEGDWVRLRSDSEGGIEMSGWHLRQEEPPASYAFPDGFVLRGMVEIRVWCGNDGPAELYMCAQDGVWDVWGSELRLLDREDVQRSTFGGG